MTAAIRTQRPDRWGVTAAPSVPPRYQARRRSPWWVEALRIVGTAALLSLGCYVLLVALLLLGDAP